MPKHNKTELGEFDLIGKYFTRHIQSPDKSVILGIGDDCALLNPGHSGTVLAITTDMLVEDRHFFSNVNPRSLGHKALAVNLSDLAAMGAKPTAFTLSLALPTLRANNSSWMKDFSDGIFGLADLHQCQLIGGDTTAGPLTINITAIGEVPPEQALRRDKAKPGDEIWVSHNLGDARWALGHLRGEWNLPEKHLASSLSRLEKPTPRIELGLQLRNIANAAVDISDGLLGDLQHILTASHVSATVYIDKAPCSEGLGMQSSELRRLCTLRGGDDYELCFTASKNQRTAIESVSNSLGIKLTCIGEIKPSKSDVSQLVLIDQGGAELPTELVHQYLKSFDHFK